MAILYDARGNEYVGSIDHINGVTITDARAATVNLGSLNAETLTYLNGDGTVSVQITGTWVGTISFDATIDGTNYFAIPLINQATETMATTTTANAVFTGDVSGYRIFRVRMSAYTSGTAVVAVRGSRAVTELKAFLQPATLVATTLGTANTATTLTINAAGAGLYHYLTHLEVWQVNASAAAVAASATLGFTTTNLPGSLAWTFCNGIAAWTTLPLIQADYTMPLKSSAANTNTTIVAPAAGVGVQWRITAYYYVGA
jgi:hypothetical protein